MQRKYCQMLLFFCFHLCAVSVFYASEMRKVANLQDPGTHLPLPHARAAQQWRLVSLQSQPNLHQHNFDLPQNTKFKAEDYYPDESCYCFSF